MNIDKETCEKYKGKWYKFHTDYGENACVGIKLRNVMLYEADLSNASLRNANLSEANLFGANLSHANLRETNLSDSTLWDADLSKADLWKANLSEASFWKANLSKADLSEANLSNVDLEVAKLNEESVESLLKIEPYHNKNEKEQVEENKKLIIRKLLSNEKDRELIKQELLLSGV